MSIKTNFIKECVRFCNREDIKHEMITLISSLIQAIIRELYPYIFLCLILILISFLLIIGIFVMLLYKQKLL